LHLIGLDIGFSQRKRTNAIAAFDGKRLEVRRLTVDERNARLATLRDIDAIAIDAPIVPDTCAPDTAREVERIFSRGVFQKRCKPGMSHVGGTGRTLREHGRDAARLVAPHVNLTRSFLGPYPEQTLVEAFPNAFLGILVDDKEYEARPKMKRGSKFDWLYDVCVTTGRFAKLLEKAYVPKELWPRFLEEKDHEHRAALVCLLTAIFAYQRRAAPIGDAAGGYFFLPPLNLWSGWARDAMGLRDVIVRCRFPFPPQEPRVIMPESCSAKCPNYDARLFALHSSITPTDRALLKALRSFGKWMYADGEDYRQELRHAAHLYTREDHQGTCIPKTMLFMFYKNLQYSTYTDPLKLRPEAAEAMRGNPAPAWPDGELAQGDSWNNMFGFYSLRYDE
jgi:predicted RNase H-like nuclease